MLRAVIYCPGGYLLNACRSLGLYLFIYLFIQIMIFLGNTANSRRQKTLRTILSIHHHAHTVVQALLLLFAEYTARRITPVAHDLKDSSSRLQHLKPRCIHAWTLTITCDCTRGAHGVTV